MNPNMNEDVMWERLKDLQHEAENRRRVRPRLGPTLRFLAERVWLLAGLAARRAPRSSAPSSRVSSRRTSS